jgi:hypothetical protein
MKKTLPNVTSIIICMIFLISCEENKDSQTQKNFRGQQNTISLSSKNLQPQYVNIVPVIKRKQVMDQAKINQENRNIAKQYENSPEIYKYEYDLQKNPLTGKIPNGVNEASLVQARTLPSKENAIFRSANLNTYTPAGPDNLGGRTRSVGYDVRFASTKVIIAGSTSSGVYRTTNGGTSWTLVVGTNNIHDISCVAQDSRAGHEDTWYIGTGEYEGSTGVGFQRPGNGVYKSVDNGLTWNRLVNSNTGAYESVDDRKDFITRIVVNPTNGDVLIATSAAIFRSADGGNSWTNVLGKTAGTIDDADVTDIVCSSGGVYYAAFAGTANIGATLDGIWTSPTGLAGSWTRIAGNGSPAGWKANDQYQRIVLALAPSNQNVLYALYNNKVTTTADCDFFRYDASGTGAWSANLSSNLPREGQVTGNFDTQGGYDIVVAVKPDNPDFVIMAGTTAYTSPNGFATANNFKRIGGYADPASYTGYPNHHADIHFFAFEPGSNIKMLSGDDGGMQVTNDVTASTVVWTPINNSYQTYQYNYVAIDPTAGSNKYIGGSQDNGTTYKSTSANSYVSIYSGDGASVGISAGNVYHYVASQEGDIQRETSAGGEGSATNIKPAVLGTSKGIFYTLFYLDPDNTENLYYANFKKLFRTSAASTVSPTSGWDNMTGVSSTVGSNIRSFATTRGTYDANHYLFMGTEGGKIFRIKDPLNTDPATVPDDITPSGMTLGSTVLGIATAPGSKDTVLAVVSNFGVPSIFWTGNATAATPVWYIVEGTGSGKLDLPSFRSCAIVRKGSSLEFYAGTAVGLYSATSIDGTSQTTANNTSWVREGTNIIDFAIVASVPVRTSDNTMLVGTHGNGMFVANIGTSSSSLITDYFRTKQSGNWNNVATWESSPDNITWQAATLTPDHNSNTITVLNSHTVTVTANVTADQTVINNGGGIAINNGAKLFINDGPGFDITINGSLTVQTGGNMTLKSTAAGTASIGTSTGTLSGDVTVERYISNRRAWRLLCITGSRATTQSIKAAWMEGANNAASDPSPGYGTHITTFSGDLNAPNFDAIKPASSIRRYKVDPIGNFNSDAAHTPNVGANFTSSTAMEGYSGYFIFVRGDRSIDRTFFGAPSSSTILRFTGTPNLGNVLNEGEKSGDFSLINNPYPASLNFDAVKTIATNGSLNTFYIWDATLGTVGQYRTIQITGTGPSYNYTATPGIADNNWRFIEPGTAFMIPGSRTMDFSEATKSSGTPPSSMLRTVSGTETELAVNLNIINADNSVSLADGIREVFNNTYAATIDRDDARKITGFDLNFGIVNNNEVLAIEKRPIPNSNEVIGLKLWNATPGNYQFEVQPANFSQPSLVAYIKDNFLNTYSSISLTGDTKINFSITAEAASAANNRFSIVFTKSALINPSKQAIVVYPNPVQNGLLTLQLNNMPKGIYFVRLLNGLGQTILRKQINHSEGNSTETLRVNKLKGSYMLEITNPDNFKSTTKLIIN